MTPLRLIFFLLAGCCGPSATVSAGCRLTVLIAAASSSHGLDADGMVLSRALGGLLGQHCVEVFVGKAPPQRRLTHRDVVVTLEHPVNHTHWDDAEVFTPAPRTPRRNVWIRRDATLSAI